ncbi:uroporphyrinogen-III synthase [Glaciecola petra]|uniref:Uroporphyrinogen-III synthase n=1 Tax=Glaciecola petra TaxID=3075602 RepID=A0ABU2ZXM7_9ALTE|nr:uroporphyrinogen-III synthase [Aestuariibacter sp. P117]MDT0596329.1 uroporphyrinogen-III synthase [Aestuariibacter sp. P117]
MTFLVARPQQKAQQTSKLLAEKGLPAKAFPLIDIDEIDQKENTGLLSKFLNATAQKILVVTSTYAAKWLTQQALTTVLRHVDIVSIGASTANIIDNAEMNTYIESMAVAKPESSEGALSLPILTGKLNAHICILKGVGGRQLLAQQLQQRGAIVHSLDVYKRTVSQDVLRNYAFEQKQIKCIIATSVEIIDALYTQIFVQQQDWLKTLVWIVPSDRIKTQLQINGINTVYVSQGASSKALSECAEKLVITGVVNV